MDTEQYQVSTSDCSLTSSCSIKKQQFQLKFFSLVQQCIAQKNSSLQDLHHQINRLANLESQVQAQNLRQQELQAQQMQNQQLRQIANMMYGSQQYITGQHNCNPMSSQTNYGSSPHLSQSQYQQMHYNNVQRPPNREPIQYINEQGQYISSNMSRESSPFAGQENGQYASTAYPSQQFYLHDNNTPPQVPARRTWAQSTVPAPVPQQQQQQVLPLDINAWAQNSPKVDTHMWKPANQVNSNVSLGGGGFMLHQQNNGINSSNDYGSPSPMKRNDSPQHVRVNRQIHTMSGNNGNSNGPQDYGNHSNVGSSPMSHHSDYRDNRLPLSPAIDDMAPQSISFIGDEDSVDLITEHAPPHHPKRNTVSAQHQQQQQHYNRPNVIQHEQGLDLAKLNITSGKLTYRIPSPTRPSLNMNSFQVSVASTVYYFWKRRSIN